MPPMKIVAESAEENSQRIWKNATWLSAIPLVLNVVALLSTGYITRRVGADGFGRFAIGLALVGLAQMVTDLGLRALAVRDLSRSGTGSHRSLADLLSLRLGMSIIAVALAWVIALAVSADSRLGPIILITSVTIVPTALAGIFSDSLVARDKAPATVGATFWSGLLLTISSVVAVAIWPTEIALAASYVVGPLVNVSLLAHGSRREYGPVPFRWRPRHWRVLIRRALPFFKTGVLGTAIVRFETPIIGSLFGTQMAGIYAAAISLSDRLVAVIDSIATATLPTLMRSRGDASRVTDTLARILHPMLGAILAGVIMAMMGTTAAATVVFGADYAAGGLTLAVALFTLPIIAVNNLVFEGFVALNRVGFATATNMRGQAVTALLMPFLPMLMGLPGIPLAKIVGGLTVAISRVDAGRTAFVGLWGRSHLATLARRCLWALPVAVLLWSADFSPVTEVLIAGGSFACWLAATAHSSGVLLLLRGGLGKRGQGEVPPDL